MMFARWSLKIAIYMRYYANLREKTNGDFQVASFVCTALGITIPQKKNSYKNNGFYVIIAAEILTSWALYLYSIYSLPYS